jgi:uncharacterized membrane protein YdjX (TVP38/TMEM64 family)
MFGVARVFCAFKIFAAIVGGGGGVVSGPTVPTERYKQMQKRPKTLPFPIFPPFYFIIIIIIIIFFFCILFLCVLAGPEGSSLCG